MRKYAAAILASLTVLGAWSLAAVTTDDQEVYASVDGVPITSETYHAYEAVFRDPEGRLIADPDQILLSLINQALVEREATSRGISVNRPNTSAAVGALESAGIPPGAFDPAGGSNGFEERARMLELFKRVKAAVTEPVHVSPEDLEAGYAADDSLHVLGPAAGMDVIRERLVNAEVDKRWAAWLADRRRCADIFVLGPVFALPSATADPLCGVR